MWPVGNDMKTRRREELRKDKHGWRVNITKERKKRLTLNNF